MYLGVCLSPGEGGWGFKLAQVSTAAVSNAATGRNSSLVVCWLLLAVLLDSASWVRSSSEENFFPVEGIFPLQLIWVLTPFP